MPGQVQAPLTLTPEELKQLTGRVQFNAQARVLRALGIEHKRRPDGSIVVFRQHLNLPGVLASAKVTPVEPDWQAL